MVREIQDADSPRKPKTMTVGELRKALVAFPPSVDNCEVIVRVMDDDIGGALGGLVSVSVETGCTDTLAMILDADAESEMLYDSIDRHESLLDTNS